MKISATLAFVLAFAASAHPTAKKGNEYTEKLMSRLAEIAINEQTPPKFTSSKEWQPTCIEVLFGPGGEQVSFWHQGNLYPKDIESKRAYAIRHVETAAINHGDEKMTISVSKSTLNSKEETKGWTIGARLSASFGKQDVAAGGVELSASYSDTKTTTTTNTVETKHEGSCKPGYECSIQTWTFHLDVGGNSTMSPYYQLWSQGGGYGPKVQTCQMKQSEARCEQFRQRLGHWCHYSPQVNDYAVAWATWHPGKWPPAPRNRNEKIELTLPIYEENGQQLMSRVVFRSDPINMKSRDVSEDTQEETQQTIMEAIEKGTEFQFLD